MLRQLNPQEVAVELRQHIESIGEAECDEMWSFVGSKAHQRWLWYAIDHATGKVLAYVLGSRKDEAFIKLKALLEPFVESRVFTQTIGVLMNVILNLKTIVLVKKIPKRLNEKIASL